MLKLKKNTIKIGSKFDDGTAHINMDGTTDISFTPIHVGIVSASDNIIDRRKLYTATGRGNLSNGILEKPHKGWYRNLPLNP